MVRMIMHGCNGKMGQVISEICRADEEIEIVAGVDPYTGKENPYPVFPNIEECKVRGAPGAGSPVYDRAERGAAGQGRGSWQAGGSAEVGQYVTGD